MPVNAQQHTVVPKQGGFLKSRAGISPTLIKKMLVAAGIKSSVKHIDDKSTGMLNAVFKVSFVANKSPLVLRVRTFQHPEYGQEFAAERFAYHMIEGSGINHPAMHFVCLDATIHGYPFAVFDYVDGPTLDTVLADRTFTKVDKTAILGRLGESLSRLHRFKGPGFGTLTSIWFSNSQRKQFWAKLFKAEQERLTAYNSELGKKYSSVVDSWIDDLNSFPAPLGDPRLVHGDIHGRNIIVAQQNKASLIDWEASRFRIAPFEFAQIHYLNLRNDRSGWNSLTDAYVSSSEARIDKPEFMRAVEICEAFWHLRMGLFQRQFSFGEGVYFSYADKHISRAARFINQYPKIRNQPRP